MTDTAYKNGTQSRPAAAFAASSARAENLPEFANRAESLLDAQRAWIPFRDTECGLAYALCGSGSLRQIAGASCLMDMISIRVMDIRFAEEKMF